MKVSAGLCSLWAILSLASPSLWKILAFLGLWPHHPTVCFFFFFTQPSAPLCSLLSVMMTLVIQLEGLT